MVSFVGPAQAATSGTVLNLSLNETSGKTAFDTSGLGNNGSFGSGVTVGQPGPSFLFTNGHITVNSSSSLNPGSSTFTFSLSFASNPNATPPTSTNDYDLMRKGLATTSGGDFKMELLPKPTCFFRGGGTAERSVASARSVLDGSFHSIACKRSGTTISVTTDGVTTNKSATTGSVSNTASLTIGAKDTGGDQTKGYLRNVKMVVG